MPRTDPRVAALALTAAALLGAAAAVYTISIYIYPRAEAQEGPDWHNGLPRQHKSDYLVHDLDRPKPPGVMPGSTPRDPPSDAVVLFGGTDLSQWERARREGGAAEWKVENGYAEQNDTGSIRTREKFGDCQLHIEWRNPETPRGVSQARGNSGIIFMERYEVQVLDNDDNKTYADGYCAAVYGQQPPLSNACRPSGEWQTYDIIFRRPRFQGKEVVEPARVTVFHNGVAVQHHAEVFGRVAWRKLAVYEPHSDAEPLLIQDHGDKQPMRFRNIWIRRLDLSGAE